MTPPSVSLSDALPAPGEDLGEGDLLDRFLDVQKLRGLELYAAQEEALLELWDDKHVILATPTGSGKSLVAAGLHFLSIARGRKSVYTCPVKALVNEKWMALCKEFGPQNVGLSTGDATVNREAPILCCTAEILMNMALAQGDQCLVNDVVMDEFHYYGDRERGVAWQVPLLILPRTRFLLMSATLGDTSFFAEDLLCRSGRPVVEVSARTRPVPLEFSWSMDILPNAVQNLVRLGRAPVYVVHFTQADAARSAQDFTSLDLCTREEKAALARATEDFRFSSPYGPDLKRWLRQGIGLHHAGLLPKYRILVEKLAQQGLLKAISGTDTLGVGVNVPIRTVLLTRLCKWNGEKTAILSPRDFHQIAGRAGRRGFDDVGYVVAQAPEHVIENARAEAKAASSGRKVIKSKPPEKGYVPWDEAIFRRLTTSAPEPLKSSFRVTHSMLLSMLSRPDDGCRALRQLIAGCHEGPKDKIRHRQRAFALFRPLVERGIVEFVSDPHPGAAKVRLASDLRRDFGLSQPLSLWLLDVLPTLDPESPDHALDVLTLCECVVEDPDTLLRQQLQKLKDRKMAEMKAQGVEYEARVAELEAMEHPKPLREFVYGHFDVWREEHPWAAGENVRPKSIAREMHEGCFAFSGYVKEYGLQRVEGLLLRHLNAVWRVLATTVPQTVKSEEVSAIEEWLRTVIRQVDSSLLEEWERLRDPSFTVQATEEIRPSGSPSTADLFSDPRRALASLRARVFPFLRAFDAGDLEEALLLLDSHVDAAGTPWTPVRLSLLRDAHREGRGRIRLDPEGRALRHSVLTPGEQQWRLEQMLQDTAEANDWEAVFVVDVPASRAAGDFLIGLEVLGPLG